ncbi:hypothetical protein J4Q44_G00112740 [Coregonus suidteri]|uniref:Uncharacterized protein n=1 Tax=Coregonus suidteri TaxID=861788 RepID=A0AAN8LSQ8_9TELE
MMVNLPRLGAPCKISPRGVAMIMRTEEGETVEEGDCGVPSSCDAVKSCLMRIPHAPACLNSFNNLLKEHNITPPKLPPMPQLPTNLSQFTSQVTQLVPSLPPELSQEFFHSKFKYLSSYLVYPPTYSSGYPVYPKPWPIFPARYTTYLSEWDSPTPTCRTA